MSISAVAGGAGRPFSRGTPTPHLHPRPCPSLHAAFLCLQAVASPPPRRSLPAQPLLAALPPAVLLPEPETHLISLIKCIHLPNEPGAQQGRKSLCEQGCTLAGAAEGEWGDRATLPATPGALLGEGGAEQQGPSPAVGRARPSGRPSAARASPGLPVPPDGNES